MLWNTLYTPEYGYVMEHLYTRTSGYGYGIEHPVYISVVMQWVQQSCRWKSVFGAKHVDVEYLVKIELKFSLTNVHFVEPHYRMAK